HLLCRSSSRRHRHSQVSSSARPPRHGRFPRPPTSAPFLNLRRKAACSMNEILLTPTDVLFFRDGRPMSGSLAGHGAAWPLPTVSRADRHAALWHCGLANHTQQPARKEGRERSDRQERFGSLTTVGPSPVYTRGHADTWFFPAPADARVQPELASDKKQPGK